MQIEWRTIQFFLDKETYIASEVSVDAMNPKKVKCSCIKFSKFAKCKHVLFIKEKIKENGGVFNLSIPEEVSDETAHDALRDSDLFRELVLKYGKIIEL
jgi:hypothetical protein